jgi:hypothetical protein
MTFAANAFHAGVAKANAGLKGLSRSVAGLKQSFSLLGGALLLGGVSAILGSISRQMTEMRQSGDLINISEEQLRRLENARSNIKMMRDAMMGVIARGASNVIEFFAGKSEGPSLDEIAFNQKQTDEARKLRIEIEKIHAARTEGIEDDAKALEKEKAYAMAVLRTADNQVKQLEAVKEILQIEDKIAALQKNKKADITVTKAAGSSLDAGLLRQMAVDPSMRKGTMNQLRAQARDDRRFDQLVRQAKEKLDPNSSRFGMKLTTPQKLALASSRAEASDPLKKIEDHTKRTADSVEAALGLRK